jgi:hypothetical protein
MKVPKRKLHLKLKAKLLFVRRVSSREKRCVSQKWKIRKAGTLPREMFFLIRNMVRYQSLAGDKSKSVGPHRGVVAGLKRAADAFGCEFHSYGGGKRISFQLRSQPLITFEITSDPDTYKPSRTLLSDPAVFRWSVKIHNRRYVQYVPHPANPDWCE